MSDARSGQVARWTRIPGGGHHWQPGTAYTYEATKTITTYRPDKPWTLVVYSIERDGSTRRDFMTYRRTLSECKTAAREHHRLEGSIRGAEVEPKWVTPERPNFDSGLTEQEEHEIVMNARTTSIRGGEAS